MWPNTFEWPAVLTFHMMPATAYVIEEYIRHTQKIYITGRFVVEEFLPYDPSNYVWSAQYVVFRESDEHGLTPYGVDAEDLDQALRGIYVLPADCDERYDGLSGGISYQVPPDLTRTINNPDVRS